MKFKLVISLVFGLIFSAQLMASKILIQMDETQANHLKAYGIAFWVLQNDIEIEWLLNYRGGSFMVSNYPDITKECDTRGVSYQVIADVQAANIYSP